MSGHPAVGSKNIGIIASLTDFHGPVQDLAGLQRQPLKCAGAADTVDPHDLPKPNSSGENPGETPRENSGHPDHSQGSGRVPMIYKICPASAWREAERQGVFRGSPDDLRDGFIHFSTAPQVAETARKFFRGQ